MGVMQLAISMLAGLATAIPLVIKLVEFVQKATKERNWARMLNLVMGLMQTAEDKFENGADRRDWVLAMVKSSADNINYDVDMDAIGKLIDDLCSMSKIVNSPREGVA